MTSHDLPQVVLYVACIPSLVLLLLVGLYHLLPLLTLLPNLHSSPALRSLGNILPTPKRNLPRAAFNLPPRSAVPSDAALDGRSMLSIRGKVILLLVGHSAVGLASGWAYLAIGKGWPLVAVASTTTLSAIACLSVFSLYRDPAGPSGWLMRGGGITHTTIFARVLPLSLVAPVVTAGIAAAGTPVGPYAILAVSSDLVAVVVIGSIVSGYRLYVTPRKGALRLASPEAEKQRLSGIAEESWLTEPSQPTESSHISAFSFSPTPSLQTTMPRHPRQMSSTNNTPTSWLTSPSGTPQTLPSWDLTPTIATPQVAHTRQRPSCPAPSTRLPRAVYPVTLGRYKISAATTMTASTAASPGGSILAGYAPDPAQPVPPRGFASLTSFPLSPDEMEMVGGSPVSGTAPYGGSASGVTFIPEEREEDRDPRASSWTLETYYSASEAPVTPSRNGSVTPATGHRVSQLPFMPFTVPLAATPSARHSETTVGWGPRAKESREWLMGERDWVEVEREVEAMDDWSRHGRGAGFFAIVGVLACYALSVPMIIRGQRSSVHEILYLVSIALPSPMIAAASYLLRCRQISPTRAQSSQHIGPDPARRSLGLHRASELSLRLSDQPNLALDVEKQNPAPVPFASSGEVESAPLPYIVHGPKDADGQSRDMSRDRREEQRRRKNMHRRSTDIWLEEGLAVGGVSRWSRTAEMLKPHPALCVLDSQQSTDGVLKRLRGGVVSMMPKRFSAVVEAHHLGTMRRVDDRDAPTALNAINITSPSKTGDRPPSTLSEVMSHEGEVVGDTSVQQAEIQIATTGRMSVSPVFFSQRSGSAAVVKGQSGYDLDWMTAGMLPTLVPTLKIGSQIRIGPGPGGVIQRSASQPIMRIHVPRVTTGHDDDDDDSVGPAPSFRSSMEVTTPTRRTHRRAYSSSVDFTASPDFRGAVASTPYSSAARHSMLRHEAAPYLPGIPPADFADIRRSLDDYSHAPRIAEASSGGEQDTGVDLPPIPAAVYAFSRRHLSRLTERDETNESSLMREAMADMGEAILALASPALPRDGQVAQADKSAASAQVDLADLAPIVLHSDHLMKMDTPSRAELAISPPGSSYAPSLGGSESRASLWTAGTSSSIGFDRMPSVASRLSVARVMTPVGDDEYEHDVDTTPGRYTDADESGNGGPFSPESYAPITPAAHAPPHQPHPVHPPPPKARHVDLDISELRDDLTLPLITTVPMLSAHPHPPPAPQSAPRPLQRTTSIPNFSRPGTPSLTTGTIARTGLGGTSTHPALPLQTLQTLRSRRSNEILASVMTRPSDVDHATKGPSVKGPLSASRIPVPKSRAAYATPGADEEASKSCVDPVSVGIQVQKPAGGNEAKRSKMSTRSTGSGKENEVEATGLSKSSRKAMEARAAVLRA